MHEAWHAILGVSILALRCRALEPASVLSVLLFWMPIIIVPTHRERVELPWLWLLLLLLLLLLRHLSELVEVDSHVHACKHIGLMAWHAHHVLRRLLLIGVLACRGSLLLHATAHTCWGLLRGGSAET